MPPVQANSKAFAYFVLSVADMDQALALWGGRFGMDVVVRREGTDPGLAAAWGLESGEIIDQALLLTPGMQQGGVHLVRFRLPGPAVREGASPTDLVPKSVDIAARDIQARYAELNAAGYRFRSPIGRFETDGVVVHEVHLPGPDAVNLVFLEQEGKPEPVSEKGYGVAPQIVAISPDNLREKAFFEAVLGLDETSYHRFGGPEVERTIGLPSGAGLDVRIFGDASYGYGRLEIVQYEGVVSRNLYPNIDFYSGIIYRALGIPTNMFTVMFALGRLPGWIAQWKEMREDPQTKIYRPRQIYTGSPPRQFVPLGERL